jgi:hypothetical protein
LTVWNKGIRPADSIQIEDAIALQFNVAGNDTVHLQTTYLKGDWGDVNLTGKEGIGSIYQSSKPILWPTTNLFLFAVSVNYKDQSINKARSRKLYAEYVRDSRFPSGTILDYQGAHKYLYNKNLIQQGFPQLLVE